MKRNTPQPSRERGLKLHPLTLVAAPEGLRWVQSAMNREWVLEAEGTPFTCSVASETYWCS